MSQGPPLIDVRHLFGRVVLLYGSRSPEQVLFREELETLIRRRDAEILLSVPATSIAGGTTQINKNIIAQRVLGLPRG